MTGLAIAFALIGVGALLATGAFVIGLTMTRDGRDSSAVLWAFGGGLAGVIAGVGLLLFTLVSWLVGAG